MIYCASLCAETAWTTPNYNLLIGFARYEYTALQRDVTTTSKSIGSDSTNLYSDVHDISTPTKPSYSPRSPTDSSTGTERKSVVKELTSKFTQNATIAVHPVPKRRQIDKRHPSASYDNAHVKPRRPLPELPRDDEPAAGQSERPLPESHGKQSSQSPQSANAYLVLAEDEKSEEISLKPTILPKPKPSRDTISGSSQPPSFSGQTTPAAAAAARLNIDIGCTGESETEDAIYTTYTDVPKTVQHMTKLEVADCLRLLRLHKYADVFLTEDVDGSLLQELDKDILVSDFGMSTFEAVKLHKFVHDGWRPKLK